MPRARCQADPEAGQPGRQAGRLAGRQVGRWVDGKVGAGREHTDLLGGSEPGRAQEGLEDRATAGMYLWSHEHVL